MGSEKPNFSSFDLEKALTSFPGFNDNARFFCLVYAFLWWYKFLIFSATGQHFVCGPRNGVEKITNSSLVRGLHCYYRFSWCKGNLCFLIVRI